MIEIDGSYGSGGGQILRTAIGLSALTLKPCRVYNIRAKRPNPGLQEQHLQAINAVRDLCDGKLEGAVKKSIEIVFFPGEKMKKELKIEISTAGSVGLVLQAILIAALKVKNLSIEIIGGGTWGKWAPPVEYIRQVLARILALIGINLNIQIIREGFYPKGGAIVKTNITVSNLKPISLTERQKVVSIHGVSVASMNLREKKVAHRQAEGADKVLFNHFKINPSIDISYVNTISPGTGITLWITTKDYVIGADALGEPGKPAEDVGKEAAKKLINEYENGVIDSHMADQLLPFIALCGGEILISKITDHCLTNAYIIEKFLPVKFKFEDKLIKCEIT